MMEICRLCRETEIDVIHRGTRDRDDIDVLRCRSCGFVFLSKIETSGAFYANGDMRRGTDFHQWKQNTYQDDRRRFEHFRTLISGKSIMDFGCGNATFLEMARSEGKTIKAVGIDPDLESLRYLKEHGITCYEDISLVPLQETFDFVFMFHVIEHLADPRKILDSIFDHLHENGELIIETPNADDALLSYYKCDKFADFTYWSPHICLYNEKTLSILLDRVGYKMLEIQQVQRYPLANHLYWLAEGLPGGGVRDFQELNESSLNKAYADVLGAHKMCDTLLCRVGRVVN